MTVSREYCDCDILTVIQANNTIVTFKWTSRRGWKINYEEHVGTTVLLLLLLWLLLWKTKFTEQWNGRYRNERHTRTDVYTHTHAYTLQNQGAKIREIKKNIYNDERQTRTTRHENKTGLTTKMSILNNVRRGDGGFVTPYQATVAATRASAAHTIASADTRRKPVWPQPTVFFRYRFRFFLPYLRHFKRAIVSRLRFFSLHLFSLFL